MPRAAPRRFAEDTSVPVEQTKGDLEVMLRRRGAEAFAYAWSQDGRCSLRFVLAGLPIRIAMAALKPEDVAVSEAALRRAGNNAAQLVRQRREQEERRRWRALALVVKANLEAIDSGITTVMEAFFPWLVLPNGATVWDVHGEPSLRQVTAGELAKLPSRRAS